MIELITAVGLAIALEGIVYALFPDAMKRFMLQMLALPDTSLRRSGLFVAVVGVVIVLVARSS